MKSLTNPLCQSIDRFTETCGRWLAYLNLAMVLLICCVVVLRYAFNQTYVPLQESILYLHATLFMLASAYTLKQDAHVRVDILYRNFSTRQRAWIDLLGTLFLLWPVVGLIAWNSWPYVTAAWAIGEKSAESSGLPLVYLLKSLIPLMCALLALQGLAELLRNLQLLRRPTHAETL